MKASIKKSWETLENLLHNNDSIPLQSWLYSFNFVAF